LPSLQFKSGYVPAIPLSLSRRHACLSVCDSPDHTAVRSSYIHYFRFATTHAWDCNATDGRQRPNRRQCNCNGPFTPRHNRQHVDVAMLPSPVSLRSTC